MHFSKQQAARSHKLGFFVKRNEGFHQFEQEFGFKVITGLGLTSLQKGNAYSAYLSQFTRLYKFYSNLIGLYPFDTT